MTEEERGQALGRIEGGLTSLHERFDRHDRVHVQVQERLDRICAVINSWKGARALGRWIFGAVLGASGLLVSLWAAGALTK